MRVDKSSAFVLKRRVNHQDLQRITPARKPPMQHRDHSVTIAPPDTLLSRFTKSRLLLIKVTRTTADMEAF
jgi:hypothetical protein